MMDFSPVDDVFDSYYCTAGLRAVGFKVIACDLSHEMLKQNKCEFRIRCEACYLPIKSEACDAIGTYAVFHHVTNTGRLLQEFVRISSKSSVLYFDGDPFVGQKTKSFWKETTRNKMILSFGFFLWLLMEPRFLKRLLEYAAWGRRKHKQHAQRINRKAMGHNPMDTKEVMRFLEDNGYGVEVIVYKRPTESGSMLRARRRAHSTQVYQKL